MAISSNGMSQNNNFLPVSSSDIPRTKPVSVPSNGIAVSSSHMTMAANQMQRDNIQRSQLSNEMQRYTDGVGLDLSINNVIHSFLVDIAAPLPIVYCFIHHLVEAISIIRHDIIG
jgi:hypothetical protein